MKDKKKLISVLYILFTFSIVFFLAIYSTGTSDFFDGIKNMLPEWVVLMFLCIFSYYVLENFTIWIFLRKNGNPINFIKCMRITQIGFYYSAITPLSTGGQPIQIYRLNKLNVPISVGTAMFTIKFLIFQSTCVFFALLSIFFNLEFLSTQQLWVNILIIIGIIIGFATIFLVFFIFKKRELTHNFINSIINFLAKIKLIKKRESVLNKVSVIVDDYYASLNYITNNKKNMLVSMILVTFLQLFAYMCVAYFTYRAFGLSFESPFLIISIQYILYNTVSYTPLPGASGAQEGLFYLMYNNILPQNKILIMMVVWRFFTYTLCILIGGFIIFTERIKVLFEKKKNI